MFKTLLKQKLSAQAALLKLATDTGRAMTAEEQTQFDALEVEIVGLEKSIDAEERLEARNKILGTAVNVPIYAEPKDHNQKKWKAGFGEFLKSVQNAATPGSIVDSRLYNINAASGMNEAVPSEGGFLVDVDFLPGLLQKTYDNSILASRINSIPISASKNGIKINGIDETSRANGSRYGGVQAFWSSEAQTITGTKPKFTEITLALQKLIGLCYSTDELLEDTVALESVISDAFSNEFAFKLDDAILNGTGLVCHLEY